MEKEIQLWDDLSSRYEDMKILFEFAYDGDIELIEIQKELAAYKNIIDERNCIREY